MANEFRKHLPRQEPDDRRIFRNFKDEAYFHSPNAMQFLQERDIRLLSLEDINFDECVALGSGSYGTCYRSLYNGKEIVIKHFKCSSIKYLCQEADMLHLSQGIEGVPVLYGVVANPPLLVMSYQGDSLNKIIDYISTSDKLAIIHNVSQILSKLHKRNIVHIDLKSDNICIASNGYQLIPSIIDFGISTIVPYNKFYRKLYVCPPHTDPYVLSLKSSTPLNDIYSVGRLIEDLLGKVHDKALLKWVEKATTRRPEERKSLKLLQSIILDILGSKYNGPVLIQKRKSCLKRVQSWLKKMIC